MSLWSGIMGGGNAGGAADYWTHSTKTASPGNQLGSMWPEPPHGMRPNDIVVRKAKNGYTIIAVGNYGEAAQEYVAEDIDKVGEVLKLVEVNRALDKAK